MIDKQAILERADLLTIAEHDTQLKYVSSTNGGEWAGPCPFCGGRDRFRVQPNMKPWGLWMCRNCSDGKWKNAIDYVISRDGFDFKAACQILTGGDLPTTRKRLALSDPPAYSPPNNHWQAQALLAVDKCAGNLRQAIGEPALAYLRSRGLRDETLDYFKIGYSPGAQVSDLYIPRGIVIPCINNDEVWYLKVCLLPGDPVRCDCENQAHGRKPCPGCGRVNKYRGVKGNRTAAIYNAADMIGAEIALFVEGEIDCMTAWQELRDITGVVTLGSATNRLDLATWGAYLLPIKAILTTYDTDQAGKKGAAALAELTGMAQSCLLPEGVKDINDYYQANGDLWQWLKVNLDRLGVLESMRMPAVKPIDYYQSGRDL